MHILIDNIYKMEDLPDNKPKDKYSIKKIHLNAKESLESKLLSKTYDLTFIFQDNNNFKIIAEGEDTKYICSLDMNKYINNNEKKFVSQANNFDLLFKTFKNAFEKKKAILYQEKDYIKLILFYSFLFDELKISFCLFEENLDKQSIEDYFKNSDTLLGEQSYDYKAEIIKYSKEFEDYGDCKRLEVIVENKGTCTWEKDISSLDCIPEFSTLLCKNYYFEEEICPGEQVTIYLEFLNDEPENFGEPPYFTFLQLHVHPRFFNPMLILDFSHAFEKKDNDKNEKKVEKKDEIKENDNYENDDGNVINENNEDNKIKEMEKKISQLEKKCKDREKKNKKIENEKKQLNAKFKELEEKNKVTKKENEKVNKKLSEIEKKLELLEKENKNLKEGNKEIKNKEKKDIKKAEEKLLDIEKKYELINKENKELKERNKEIENENKILNNKLEELKEKNKNNNNNNNIKEINKEKLNLLTEKYVKILEQISELQTNVKDIENIFYDIYNIDGRPKDENDEKEKEENNKKEEPEEEKIEKEERPEEEQKEEKIEKDEKPEEEQKEENTKKEEKPEEEQKEENTKKEEKPEEEQKEENTKKEEKPKEEQKEENTKKEEKNKESKKYFNKKKEELLEEKKEKEKLEEDNNNKKEEQLKEKKEIKEERGKNININLKKESLEEKKEYSYEYINETSSSIYKYVGVEEVNIKIILKNNGIKKWPENHTKLLYGKNSDLISNDIKLDPLAPNEEKEYQIKLKDLKKYKVGEYNCFFSFCINEKILGKKITFTLKLCEEKKNDDINEHQQEINDFRNTFCLSKSDYSDEKLFELLKKANYDVESAFSSLFD